MSELQRATHDDFEKLFQIRSTVPVWTGRLTIPQYIERTRRIFRHPFAQKRIETWMLMDSDDLLASLDVLNIEILKAEPGQPPQFLIVPLITSLVTAPELRGRGYASRIMAAYCDSRAAEIQVLYSDIDPHFYTKLDFHPFAVDEIEAPTSKHASFRVEQTPSPVTLEELIRDIRQACLKRAHQIEQSSVINLPTALFMDWHVERYRFFAECAEKALPRDLYWKLSHADGATEHALAVAPDFLQSQLDCLWITPDCPECVGFASTLAREWGLEKIRYWSRTLEKTPEHVHSAGAHACVPMIRVPKGMPIHRFLDPQICTWF